VAGYSTRLSKPNSSNICTWCCRLSGCTTPTRLKPTFTRSLSDQAEKAGSIQVAVIQLANTCGAAIGGVALDHLGLLSPLVISGALMLLTGLLVAVKVRV